MVAEPPSVNGARRTEIVRQVPAAEMAFASPHPAMLRLLKVGQQEPANVVPRTKIVRVILATETVCVMPPQMGGILR